MTKFTYSERKIVQSIVGLLSLRRVPDKEIAKEVYKVIGKSISKVGIYKIKQRIKKESYEWFKQLRKSEYNFIFEYKSRISEIEDLQLIHNKIVHNRKTRPEIRQASLQELHKLTKTLAELHDVAPDIVSNFRPEDNDKQEGNNTNDIIQKKRRKKQIPEPIV